MTTKRRPFWILLAATLLSACIWATYIWSKHSKRKPELLSKVFRGSCGWGYDILVGDRVLIHQESIPSQQGTCGFTREESAQKAAGIIINKMKNGQAPYLTSFDLAKIAEPTSTADAP